MSLLTQFDHVAAATPTYIQNIGGNGNDISVAPCIRGTALGAVRVGDPTNGLILRGDTVANIDQIRGGTAAGGSLLLGSSSASFQNIALTDNLTTINTPLSQVGNIAITGDLATTGNIGVGNNLVFINGNSQGDSVSGYYLASVPFAGQQVLANPAGLTAGVYSVVLATGNADREAQPSGIFIWSGTTWFGNAVSAAFGSSPVGPNCIVVPANGGATLEIKGSGAPTGNAIYRKLLNAA